jgi:Polyketide cyclase / dehydrase and lipid transport
MGQIRVKVSAVINALPEDVYASIADYKHGHPNILPKEYYDLQVERGGYGAGTIIRFKTKHFGLVRELYQQVSEPDPGHVLIEQDIDSQQQVVTTFTVTPVNQAQQALVEISTTMQPSPGLTGLVERILVSPMSTRVFRQELKLLEAFAQKKSIATPV